MEDQGGLDFRKRPNYYNSRYGVMDLDFRISIRSRQAIQKMPRIVES
jgi:hypothetical protein